MVGTEVGESVMIGAPVGTEVGEAVIIGAPVGVEVGESVIRGVPNSTDMLALRGAPDVVMLFTVIVNVSVPTKPTME